MLNRGECTGFCTNVETQYFESISTSMKLVINHLQIWTDCPTERKFNYLKEWMNLCIDLWPKKPVQGDFYSYVISREVKPFKKTIKKARSGLKYCCRYCGRSFSQVVRTIDHVVALSRGGRDAQPNRVACCDDCNQWKGGKGLFEWLREITELLIRIETYGSYTWEQLRTIRNNLKDVIAYTTDYAPLLAKPGARW